MNQVNQGLLDATRRSNIRQFFLLSGITLCFLVLMLGAYTARALDTGTVAATVSATNLAVSVTDGTINFGSVALNTATSTNGTSETQVVTNDGSRAALNIKSSNATNGAAWTLGTAPGSNIFKLEVSTTTGVTWATLQAADTYLTASSSFTSLGNSNVDFKFTTPTVSTDFVQKSLTITVQVTTP